MSISVDYFFNSEKSFEQLLKEINELLGSTLTPSKTDREYSSGGFMGMPMNFYIQTLENDRELNFQDYKHSIGVTTSWGNADLRDMQVSIVAFIAFLLYRRMQVDEGILVYDVQVLLAKYEERIVSENVKGLFDKVSNKFVELPQHLLDLNKLAWQ